MKFDKVKLFDPSGWRSSIGELASEEDRKWNWFLCSKPKYDRKHKMYIITVSPNVVFYCEKSGRTLRVNSSERPRLLVADDPRNKINMDMKNAAVFAVEELGYDGVVTRSQQSLLKYSPIYEETEFIFRDGILSSATTSKDGEQVFPERCGLVKYIKTHNSQLRSVNPRILTCSEIDDLLSNNSCETVSTILYNLLKM